MARPLDTALDYVSCRALLWGLGAATIATALKTGLQAGHGGMWGWWLVLTLLFAGLWIYTWFYCGRDGASGRSALEREQRKGVSVAAGGTALAVDGAGNSRTNVGMPAGEGQAHWSQSGARAAGDSTAGTERDAGTRQRAGVSPGRSTTSESQASTTSSAGSPSATSKVDADERAGLAAFSSMPNEGHQEASVEVRSGRDTAENTATSATSSSEDANASGSSSRIDEGTSAKSSSAGGDAASAGASDRVEDANDASSIKPDISDESDLSQSSSGGSLDSEDASASTGAGTATATSSSGGDMSGQSGAPQGDVPAVLKAARDGKPDDLKKISGVGPKLEGLLHELGFFHFDQIAQWTEENVAWVDDHLGFKGRITRDDWIGQAKKLANED